MRKQSILAVAVVFILAFASTIQAQETTPISVSQVHTEGFQWGYIGVDFGFGFGAGSARSADSTSAVAAKGVLGFGTNLDYVGNELYAAMYSISDDAQGEVFTQTIMQFGYHAIIEFKTNQALNSNGDLTHNGIGISAFAGGSLMMFMGDYKDGYVVDDMPLWLDGGLLVNVPFPGTLKDWFTVDGFLKAAMGFSLSADTDDFNMEDFTGTMQIAFGATLHFTPRLDTAPGKRWHFFAGFTYTMINTSADMIILHVGAQYGW